MKVQGCGYSEQWLQGCSWVLWLRGSRFRWIWETEIPQRAHYDWNVLWSYFRSINDDQADSRRPAAAVRWSVHNCVRRASAVAVAPCTQPRLPSCVDHIFIASPAERSVVATSLKRLSAKANVLHRSRAASDAASISEHTDASRKGPLYNTINVKKLQFIHKLTASDTSKTAKNHKKVILPTSTSPKCQCAAE